MFIEGRCLAINFAQLIAEHIQNAKDDHGEIMWEMISSNVDAQSKEIPADGWVFKSKGPDGNLNQIFAISNSRYNKDLWNLGNTVSVATDYIPGLPGNNGTFIDKVSEPMVVYPYTYDNSGFGYVEQNLPIKYFLSVTGARIILAYIVDSIVSTRITNLIFAGQPHIVYEKNNQGIILTCGLTRSTTTYTDVTLLNGNISNETSLIKLKPKASIVAKGKGWGNKVYPSHIYLHQQESLSGRGGLYGVLDLLTTNAVDAGLRIIDHLNIDSTEYLSITIPSTTNIYTSSGSTPQSYYNHFAPSSGTLAYMFPKI